jgi:transcriptional regulator GlxA family with amidase domain
VASALIRAHLRGTRIMSICTGAYVLAEAGLLDGHRATTHWSATEELASRFPKLDVDPDALYVDEGSILTSAGVAAGLDLCLHVVRKDHGAAVAADVAWWTVIAPHREGGQAQFIPLPSRAGGSSPSDGTTEPARSWALSHLDQPISVEELAGRAAMSRRTFTRRFRSETGTTPAQWLLEQRCGRPSHCWKPHISRSSRSRRRAASATQPHCELTSEGGCAPLRPPTGALSPTGNNSSFAKFAAKAVGASSAGKAEFFTP